MKTRTHRKEAVPWEDRGRDRRDVTTRNAEDGQKLGDGPGTESSLRPQGSGPANTLTSDLSLSVVLDTSHGHLIQQPCKAKTGH